LVALGLRGCANLLSFVHAPWLFALLSLIECPKLWVCHDPCMGLRDELGTMVRKVLLG
jgi:hypothetical protein